MGSPFTIRGKLSNRYIPSYTACQTVNARQEHPPASRNWETLSRLTSGAPVEVFTSDRAEKEQKFLRPDVLRVVSRAQSRRMRNALIGAGVGGVIAWAVDQSIGGFLRNESNPSSARPFIWTLPIALCGGIGAAFPSYPVIYRK